MFTLIDSIKIEATPEKIYNSLLGFFSSEENYKKWHEDHLSCKWIKGNPFELGSILMAEEYLNNKSLKLKFVGTKVEENKSIEYKLLFPFSIVLPKGSFTIEQQENYSVFIAKLYFRFGNFIKQIVKKDIDSLKEHMKEEGEKLKEIAEGTSS